MQLQSYTAVLFQLGTQRSKELCTIIWAPWREGKRQWGQRDANRNDESAVLADEADVRCGCRTQGYIKHLQCFPSFWGIVRHREWQEQVLGCFKIRVFFLEILVIMLLSKEAARYQWHSSYRDQKPEATTSIPAVSGENCLQIQLCFRGH